MREIAVACAHAACRCTISNTSPQPYCCDYCGDHVSDKGRCGCDHDACGGVPKTDVEPRDLVAGSLLDPALGRKA